MNTYLEDYIYSLLKAIKITDPKELTINNVASKLGLTVVYRRKPYRFDDEIILQHGTSQQEWQLFAHELCHYLRHSGNQLNMNPLFVELQEWQADNFTYHFCVPTFMLEEIDLPKQKIEAIGVIAETFGVEYEFARIRLEKRLLQIDGCLYQRNLMKGVM